MAKTVRFTGDKNSGLAKFAIYESTGDFDDAKEVFDETTPMTEKFDLQIDVAPATVDMLVDIVAAGVAPKKVLVKCAAALTVRFGSLSAPAFVLTGVTVLGGAVGQMYVSNPGTAAVSIRVLAGG